MGWAEPAGGLSPWAPSLLSMSLGWGTHHSPLLCSARLPTALSCNHLSATWPQSAGGCIGQEPGKGIQESGGPGQSCNEWGAWLQPPPALQIPPAAGTGWASSGACCLASALAAVPCGGASHGCAARRWLDPAAAGQQSPSHPVLGGLGGRHGLGSWECSLAQHAAAHWCRCGPTTCSHDRWPRPWWHQQMWDLLSWTGGWDSVRQPARHHAMLCCVEPRCLALPAQTGSAPHSSHL